MEVSTDTGIVPLDLSASECLTRREVEWIRSLHERTASALSSTLSTSLRYTIEMKLGPVEDVDFSTIATRLAPSSCCFLMSLGAGAGTALTALDLRLALAFVEVILGGEPRPMDGLEREVTDVELALLQDVADSIRRQWEAGWQNHLSLKFELESGMQRQEMESLFGFGKVLTVVFETKVGDVQGEILLAMPARIIRDGIRAKEQARSKPSSHPDLARQGQVLQRIQNCSLLIRATLEGATASFRDLSELRPGDVLQLNCPLGSRLSGRVNSALKFSGEIVGTGKKRGLLIHQLYGEKLPD